MACILLACLFVYDIFWVFYSAQLFGENVMLSVAQKTTTNPVAHVAKAMNITAPSLTSHLELPSKMIIPSFDGVSASMLGLGDIAVPGLLLSFLYRLSLQPKPGSYYWVALAGYATGLVITMAVSLTWRHAQPALLFLVPSTLIPVFLVSWWRGEFRALWDSVETPQAIQTGTKIV